MRYSSTLRMKKSINNLILLLSILLILPISLKWFFNYELPNEVNLYTVSIDTRQLFRIIGGIVTCYVVYINVIEYIRKGDILNRNGDD